MIIYYALRQFLPSFLRKKNYQHTDVYKSCRMYYDFRKSRTGGGKSLITIYKDCFKLSKYWHCFPNLYFNFGMFRKEWDSMEQMLSFIPQQAYSRLVKDKDPRYHILIDDKILFHTIMRQYGLPVPERFFVFQNNSFYRDGIVIDDVVVDKIISEIKDERVFIKKYKGGGASGISIAKYKNDGYYTEDDQLLSASMIRSRLNGNYIFEKSLVQESVLRLFNPNTINTIRITTYNNQIVSAAVRFGRKNSFVDNISAGGIGVSVDIETGQLGDYGLLYRSFEKLYEHPDTKIKFKGTFVPDWDKIIDLVKKTMLYLPYFKSVGFDIATTEEGPVIIEINTGCGMDIAQMGKARGIADRFK